MEKLVHFFASLALIGLLMACAPNSQHNRTLDNDHASALGSRTMYESGIVHVKYNDDIVGAPENLSVDPSSRDYYYWADGLSPGQTKPIERPEGDVTMAPDRSLKIIWYGSSRPLISEAYSETIAETDMRYGAILNSVHGLNVGESKSILKKN